MRLIKFVVNWSILLSAPLWASFVMQLHFIDGIINDTRGIRKLMAGKDWIWRMK